MSFRVIPYILWESPKPHTLDCETTAKTHKNSRHDTGHGQHDHVVAQPRRAQDQHGHEDLPHVMKDTPRHADTRGGEQIGLFEKGHAQKTQKSPRQAVGQGSGIEDEGHGYDADKGDGGGLLPAKAIEDEDDGDVGESQLDTGDGGGQGRELTLHPGQHHGNGGAEAQKGDLFGGMLHDGPPFGEMQNAKCKMQNQERRIAGFVLDSKFMITR